MTAPRSVLAGIVVLVLVGTACGSTVPRPSAQQAGAPGGGLSVPSGSTTQTGSGDKGVGGAGAVGPGGGGAAISGGGPSGTGTTGGGSGGGPSGTGSGSAQPAPANVPGVTPTTIYVGARYTKNQGAANSIIGAGGAGGSDERSDYKAVIDDINAHGGIGGRKVVPVYASVDATSNTPAEQQRQADCAQWTQDNKVFVIFAGGNDIDEECAKRAGSLGLYGSLSGGTTLPETFQQYPDYVEIVGMNLVRMGQTTVNGLASQGYFGKGARIGLMTWDDPAYKEAMQKGYIATLARHGLAPATDPVYLTPPQTVQDMSNMSAQVNAAVLKFSQLGIDHVMMLDGATGGICGVGCMGFMFMRRAQSQQYFPRYGFNDNNVPAAGYAAGFYPAEELKNSVAVGWDDFDKTYDAGWHVNQTREQCYALMRKKGVDMSNINAQIAALTACDELWFLRDAVNKLGNAPLTPANIVAAVNTFGTSYPSTQTYGTAFSSSKHDGINLVRNYHWVDSCKCFRYTSGAYRPG